MSFDARLPLSKESHLLLVQKFSSGLTDFALERGYVVENVTVRESADDPEEALEEELVRLTPVGVALRERYRSWRSD